MNGNTEIEGRAARGSAGASRAALLARSPLWNSSSGFPALFHKEVLRFWKVAFQTIGAPILTAVLYLLIFAHILEERVRVYDSISYTAFLVPGLVMMSILQNAFANSASSLIQSKITGNVIFVLLPPLSWWEFFAAYVLAAAVRGLVVGLGVWLATLPFAESSVALAVRHPLWAVSFAVMGGALMGAFGLIAAILADKIDQVAAFQNFLVMPLTFLSGVFFSIHSLPLFWQQLSHFNPFFFMIDGFRFGFFGMSDVDPLASLAVSGGCLVAVSSIALLMLRSGYKLRI